jgi:hypothetical protein
MEPRSPAVHTSGDDFPLRHRGAQVPGCRRQALDGRPLADGSSSKRRWRLRLPRRVRPMRSRPALARMCCRNSTVGRARSPYMAETTSPGRWDPPPPKAAYGSALTRSPGWRSGSARGRRLSSSSEIASRRWRSEFASLHLDDRLSPRATALEVLKILMSCRARRSGRAGLPSPLPADLDRRSITGRRPESTKQRLGAGADGLAVALAAVERRHRQPAFPGPLVPVGGEDANGPSHLLGDRPELAPASESAGARAGRC